MWLWKGFIPLGKLTILEGESDVGKSTVTLDWCRIITTGGIWPTTTIDGKELKKSQRDPAGVVLVGVEDGLADTVVPRLVANGADRRKVFRIKRHTDSEGNPIPFTIPDDVDRLRRAIRQAKAELVVIDPITAYLPERVLHGVDASIRKVLTPLAELAQETDCAIVLIRHFNKDENASAKNRGGGSVAYGAIARVVLQAVPIPDGYADNGADYALAVPIGNLARKPDAQGYRLVDAPEMAALPVPEDDELKIGNVQWCGTLPLSPAQLLGLDAKADARTNAPVLEAAKQAIFDVLRNGALNAKDARDQIRAASGAGLSTIYKACDALMVEKKSHFNPDGTFGQWTWEIPKTMLELLERDDRLKRERKENDGIIRRNVD